MLDDVSVLSTKSDLVRVSFHSQVMHITFNNKIEHYSRCQNNDDTSEDSYLTFIFEERGEKPNEKLFFWKVSIKILWSSPHLKVIVVSLNAYWIEQQQTATHFQPLFFTDCWLQMNIREQQHIEMKKKVFIWANMKEDLVCRPRGGWESVTQINFKF